MIYSFFYWFAVINLYLIAIGVGVFIYYLLQREKTHFGKTIVYNLLYMCILFPNLYLGFTTKAILEEKTNLNEVYVFAISIFAAYLPYLIYKITVKKPALT